MKKFVLLLIVPGALAAQSTNPPRITLDEAIRMAQLNAPQAVAARGAVRLAGVTTRSAQLSFAPNANVNASSTWQRGQRIGQSGSLIDFTGPSKSFNDGLSLSMELFDGGRRFFDLASARAGKEAAEAGFQAATFDLALQVKEQFYNVLAAREAETAARSQIEEASHQLRAATARLQAGAATSSDSLRSEVLLASARLALIDAETQLSIANATLTRLVGSPEPVTAADAPPDEPLPPLDFAALLAIASEGPDLARARSVVRAASATLRSAKTAYLPTINATYSRNGSGFDSKFGFRDQYAYSSSFRLNFSLPIFNQLVREENAVRATVAREQAEADLRDTELRVRQEITQALGILRSAQQRIELQELSVRAAEADLNIQQQRYDLNAASLIDVVQSQTQLAQARSGLIGARFDFRVSRARLEALLGRELTP